MLLWDKVREAHLTLTDQAFTWLLVSVPASVTAEGWPIDSDPMLNMQSGSEFMHAFCEMGLVAGRLQMSSPPRETSPCP